MEIKLISLLLMRLCDGLGPGWELPDLTVYRYPGATAIPPKPLAPRDEYDLTGDASLQRTSVIEGKTGRQVIIDWCDWEPWKSSGIGDANMFISNIKDSRNVPKAFLQILEMTKKPDELHDDFGMNSACCFHVKSVTVFSKTRMLRRNVLVFDMVVLRMLPDKKRAVKIRFSVKDITKGVDEFEVSQIYLHEGETSLRESDLAYWREKVRQEFHRKVRGESGKSFMKTLIYAKIKNSEYKVVNGLDGVRREFETRVTLRSGKSLTLLWSEWEPWKATGELPSSFIAKLENLRRVPKAYLDILRLTEKQTVVDSLEMNELFDVKEVGGYVRHSEGDRPVLILQVSVANVECVDCEESCADCLEGEGMDCRLKGAFESGYKIELEILLNEETGGITSGVVAEVTQTKAGLRKLAPPLTELVYSDLMVAGRRALEILFKNPITPANTEEFDCYKDKCVLVTPASSLEEQKLLIKQIVQQSVN